MSAIRQNEHNRIPLVITGNLSKKTSTQKAVNWNGLSLVSPDTFVPKVSKQRWKEYQNSKYSIFPKEEKKTSNSSLAGQRATTSVMDLGKKGKNYKNSGPTKRKVAFDGQVRRTNAPSVANMLCSEDTVNKYHSFRPVERDCGIKRVKSDCEIVCIPGFRNSTLEHFLSGNNR